MTLSLPMATEILPADDGRQRVVFSVSVVANWCFLLPVDAIGGVIIALFRTTRKETPDMFANELRCTTWDEVMSHAMQPEPESLVAIL